MAVCALGAWSANASTCCAYGYSGLNCDQCAPGHYGAQCDPCTCGTGGTCVDGKTGDGSCVCDLGWGGTRCDTCVAGYWGAACEACACVGGSTCDDGINGTGCLCNEGYFGASCSICTCVTNSTAHASHTFAAECADGIRGDGSCSCAAGYVGESIGCAECATERFGVSCESCDCPERTSCDDGLSGSGSCSCSDPACDTDATLDFLSVLFLDRFPLEDPLSAKLATTLTPIFSASNRAYEAIIMPGDRTSLAVAIAPSQWGGRAVVTTEHAVAGVTSVCDASFDPHVSSADVANLANATSAEAMLLSVSNPNALPTLQLSSKRLLRSCSLVPLIGRTNVTMCARALPIDT